MSKSLARVRAALAAAGVETTVLEMPGETRTAAQAAAAAGCVLDQIVKSVIFRGEQADHALLFLTAGGNHVDRDRAETVAGEPLGKADAAFIRARTGFAIGGVAPVGHLTPIRAFMDPKLSEFPEIWAAAGTPRHIFAIPPARLRQICSAQMADFTAQSRAM